MYKKITCTLLILFLSSCSLIHKPVITQGNVITDSEVKQLHHGMSEAQVKNIMGNPVLINIFSPGRLDYVYTYQFGQKPREEKKVLCRFEHGRLAYVEVSGTTLTTRNESVSH